MKVSITMYVSDTLRLALNARVKQKGLASRRQCAQIMRSLLHADLEVIESDFEDEAIQEMIKLGTVEEAP